MFVFRAFIVGVVPCSVRCTFFDQDSFLRSGLPYDDAITIAAVAREPRGSLAQQDDEEKEGGKEEKGEQEDDDDEEEKEEEEQEEEEKEHQDAKVDGENGDADDTGHYVGYSRRQTQKKEKKCKSMNDMMNKYRAHKRSSLHQAMSKTKKRATGKGREAQVPRCTLGFTAAAKLAMQAATEKAKKLMRPVSIAIVDHTTSLFSFDRMEGSPGASVDMAIRKATTSSLAWTPTKDVGDVTKPGGRLYMVHIGNGGLAIGGGGEPLIYNGKVVGGIGVSGFSEEADIAVAQAGKNAFEKVACKGPPPNISPEQMNAAFEAALLSTFNDECAAKNGAFGHCAVSVAIVDNSGHLLVFGRMDGAWLASVDMAMKKAKAAIQFCNMTRQGGTGVIEMVAQPGGPMFQVDATTNGGLLLAKGGAVFESSDGLCIGAIGVAGGHVDADQFVADAAVAAVKDGLNVHGRLVNQTVGSQLKLGMIAVEVSESCHEHTGGRASTAVTDPGGNLVYFYRDVETNFFTADYAVKKANTAVKFNMATERVSELSDVAKLRNVRLNKSLSLFLLELTNGGLVTFGGGAPIQDAFGRVAFGIGVAGGAGNVDQICARAAANKLQDILRGNEKADRNGLLAGDRREGAAVVVSSPSEVSTTQLPKPVLLPSEAPKISKGDRSAVAMTGTMADGMIEGARTWRTANWHEDNRLPENYCVVDRFGDIVSFVKQDGAWRGFTEISCSLALSALMFNMTTETLGNLVYARGSGARDHSSIGQIEHTYNYFSPGEVISANVFPATARTGGLVAFAGGAPAMVGGVLVGAIGVAGTSLPDTAAASEAGARAAAVSPKNPH